jgi:hypothetical protein
MINTESTVDISDSVFEAPLYNEENTSGTISGCTFQDIAADAAMVNEQSNLVITGCLFEGNSAGMSNRYNDVEMVSCIFRGNQRGMSNEGCDPSVTDCIFEENEAIGMYNEHSSPTVDGSEFLANGSYGMFNVGSSPEVTNSRFRGNAGAVTNSETSEPVFEACDFVDNTASGNGGAVSNDMYSWPTFISCWFESNAAEEGNGGAISDDYWSRSRIANCTFINNTASGDGGGLYLHWSYPDVINSVFLNNVAGGNGGGVYLLADDEYTSAYFIGSTFYGNSAETGGGAYLDTSEEPYIIVSNSIFWGNRSATPSDAQIWAEHATVTYSDVQGGCTAEGGCTNDDTGNLDVDPLFADAPGGDLRLEPDSQCINAGDNDALPVDRYDLDGDGDEEEALPWDIDDAPRVIDGIVDMGAYEREL